MISFNSVVTLDDCYLKKNLCTDSSGSFVFQKTIRHYMSLEYPFDVVIRAVCVCIYTYIKINFPFVMV